MDEKEKKLIFKGVRKALKKVLEDVEGEKNEFPSLRDAVYSKLDNNAREIIEQYEEELDIEIDDSKWGVDGLDQNMKGMVSVVYDILKERF